jgi:hypothetical protein
LKSPRNDTGIAMTNLHRSPPMNQSKTDLGIVHESQLLRFGIIGFAINSRMHSASVPSKIWWAQIVSPVESRRASREGHLYSAAGMSYWIGASFMIASRVRKALTLASSPWSLRSRDAL